MKKLVLSVLTLLTCGAAYALPVGNPSEASLFLHGAWWDNCGTACFDPCDPCFNWCDALSFRLGFYGDYVYNRHLQVRGDDDDDDGKRVDRTEIFTNAAYLALNFFDRVDAFATLGSTRLHIRTRGSVFGLVDTGTEAFFESHFSWSVGARATVWECNCFAVGVEGQYFRTCPKLDALLVYDSVSIPLEDFDIHGKHHEWQVGLGASYRFATPSVALVPYVAVDWSWSRLKFGHEEDFTVDGLTFNGLRAKKLWGWAIGTTLTVCDMVGVTVEGRFANEKAIYVNGEFRF